jgi:hypothetical protein
MRLTTSIIRTIPSQFKLLSAFAAIQTLEEVKGIWDPTQRVLDLYGVTVNDVKPAPKTEYEIPGFRKRVLNLVRPRLSNSIVAIFEEPTQHILPLIKEIDVETVRQLSKDKIIDEQAVMIWESSAELYANLGSQMEIVYRFITLGETVSDELIKEAKLVFVFNNADTSVLSMQQGIALTAKFTYQTALKSMIRPRFDGKVTQAIEGCTKFSELEKNHGITNEMLERFVEIGIVSKYTLLTVRNKLKSGSIYHSFLGLFRRK